MVVDESKEPTVGLPAGTMVGKYEIIEELSLGGQAVVYNGRGCNKCGGTGYSGRLPIFEFLVIDNQMRQNIVSGVSETKIRGMARKRGYGGLLESGVGKMLQGLTTFEEVIRTTFAETGRTQQFEKNLSPENVLAAEATLSE